MKFQFWKKKDRWKGDIIKTAGLNPDIAFKDIAINIKHGLP